ncbi:MAG: RNase P p30-like protein [Sulfolobaceae archaeon]
MLIVEACVLSHELIPILKKVGYDIGIIEGNKNLLSRKTIEVKDDNILSSFLRSSKKFKGIIVVKPLSISTLRYSILSKQVKMLQFDDENAHLLKKNMINLLKNKEKYIEINLNKISFFNLYKILLNFKIHRNIILSACAKHYSEIWPPLSKLNYVSIIGIPEELGIQWIFLNPNRLIISVSRGY